MLQVYGHHWKDDRGLESRIAYMGLEPNQNSLPSLHFTTLETRGQIEDLLQNGNSGALLALNDPEQLLGSRFLIYILKELYRRVNSEQDSLKDAELQLWHTQPQREKLYFEVVKSFKQGVLSPEEAQYFLETEHFLHFVMRTAALTQHYKGQLDDAVLPICPESRSEYSWISKRVGVLLAEKLISKEVALLFFGLEPDKKSERRLYELRSHSKSLDDEEKIVTPDFEPMKLAEAAFSEREQTQHDVLLFRAFHEYLLEREDVQLLLEKNTRAQTYRYLNRIRKKNPKLSEEYGQKNGRKKPTITDSAPRICLAYALGFLPRYQVENAFSISLQHGIPKEIQAELIRYYRKCKLSTEDAMKCIGATREINFIRSVAELSRDFPELLEGVLFRKGKKDDQDGSEMRRILVEHHDHPEREEDRLSIEDARLFLGYESLQSLRAGLSRIRKKNGLSTYRKVRIPLQKKYISAVQQYLTDSSFRDTDLMESLELKKPSTARYRAKVYFRQFPDAFKDLDIVPSRDPRLKA